MWGSAEKPRPIGDGEGLVFGKAWKDRAEGRQTGLLADGSEEAAVEATAEGDADGGIGAHPESHGISQLFADGVNRRCYIEVGAAFFVEVPVSLQPQRSFGGSELQQVGRWQLQDVFPKGEGGQFGMRRKAEGEEVQEEGLLWDALDAGGP